MSTKSDTEVPADGGEGCDPSSPTLPSPTPHQQGKRASFLSFTFDNQCMQQLPLDPITANYTRTVPGAIFSRVAPEPVENPQLVAVSQDCLDLLGVREGDVGSAAFVDYFCGNRLFDGAQPAAHCYCGFQFGYFSGQLGDGAAMYLGEVISPDGSRWELQFKGAGPTPYSRQGDGRKVLRSSIREFLCSEAMHFLGIPTTRACAVVTSDSLVVRDMFYDGNPQEERCTIVTRVAPTFFRFGSFEIAKGNDPDTGRPGSSPGNHALVKQLLDFTIKQYYPEYWHGQPASPSESNTSRIGETAPATHKTETTQTTETAETAKPSSSVSTPEEETASNTPSDVRNSKSLHGTRLSVQPYEEEMYSSVYREICVRTARLVAMWQSVGFCHGVLNTDNMSIIGITIDYGPFGFLDRYDPHFICNRSDQHGRYDFKSQPAICEENLGRLAEAWSPFVPKKALDATRKETYEFEFQKAYLTRMREKLGICFSPYAHTHDRTPGAVEKKDARFVEQLLECMHETGADFTNTFRLLSVIRLSDESSQEAFYQELSEHLASLDDLKRAFRPRVPVQALQQLTENPLYARSLGLSKGFLEAERAKHTLYGRAAAMTQESKEKADKARWKTLVEVYVLRLKEDMERGNAERAARGDAPLTANDYDALRVQRMNAVNPAYILRNYVAQTIIERAEEGDFDGVRECIERLKAPCHQVEDEPLQKPPEWACKLSVSCSS